MKYIRTKAGVTIPELSIARINLSDQPRGSDYDIGEMMNLIFRLPPSPCAYPEIRFDSMPGMKKPSVLVIADSYYLNLAEDYSKYLFGSDQYWFYNNRLYPYQDDVPPTFVDKTGLAEKLSSFDVILLMTSEINLHCGFWNFSDEAWLALNPDQKEDPVYSVENEIRNERSWFRFLSRQAEAERMPLDSMIRRNAEFVYYSRENR
jgi:hypothetical protein